VSILYEKITLYFLFQGWEHVGTKRKPGLCWLSWRVWGELGSKLSKGFYTLRIQKHFESLQWAAWLIFFLSFLFFSRSSPSTEWTWENLLVNSLDWWMWVESFSFLLCMTTQKMWSWFRETLWTDFVLILS